MYMKIKGTKFAENVIDEISSMTDRALLNTREVIYDEKLRSVYLPITRYKINKQKGLLGLIIPYKRDKSMKLKSGITINNVTACKIENNFDDLNISEVTILFGLQIRDNEVYLSSAEERKGVTLYTLRATVADMELEIIDQ